MEHQNGSSIKSSENHVFLPQKRHSRRTRVPDKPSISFNVWAMVKNCVGKDLTKIPLPVNFSEPLSMLQRLAEEFQYSEVLDKGADCKDTLEQLAYIAAFAVSCYHTTSVRTAKPFNPVLGETFECDRWEEAGWKLISEQVSHHPPVVAQHCESKRWSYYQEFSMTSKLKMNYLTCRVEVTPHGIVHIKFPENGCHYTICRKIKTDVHNIVVGKMFVEHYGDMEIVNHKTGEKCLLNFIPKGYFADMERKVTGTVLNSSGEVVWNLSGSWDYSLEATRASGMKNKDAQTDPPKVLWLRKPPLPDAHKFYNFSQFACQLNEPEDGVAPTDSRLRPDMRQMEEGDWDAANVTKVRVEEKQRGARSLREMEMELAKKEGKPAPEYEPLWFKKEDDPIAGFPVHVYKGKYWERKSKQDWSGCPDIF